jgi:hypothetical protein
MDGEFGFGWIAMSVIPDNLKVVTRTAINILTCFAAHLINNQIFLKKSRANFKT